MNDPSNNQNFVNRPCEIQHKNPLFQHENDNPLAIPSFHATARGKLGQKDIESDPQAQMNFPTYKTTSIYIQSGEIGQSLPRIVTCMVRGNNSSSTCNFTLALCLSVSLLFWA